MPRTKEQDRIYQLERYRSRRNNALRVLGGKCVKCGSVEDLEIDHIYPETKSFPLGQLWGVAKARYEAELQKCQLVWCTQVSYNLTWSRHGKI